MPYERSPYQIAMRAAMNDAATDLCSDEEHMLRGLPVLMQAALIQMRESWVKRAVVARLLEESQDKPHVADYEALVRLGLAEKNEADKWHRLTYLGRRIAGHLEQRLCKQFQIHLLQEAGADRFDVRFRCCCGWKTAVPKQSPSVWKNARARFTRHEASVEGIDNLTRSLRPPAQEIA